MLHYLQLQVDALSNQIWKTNDTDWLQILKPPTSVRPVIVAATQHISKIGKVIATLYDTGTSSQYFLQSQHR